MTTTVTCVSATGVTTTHALDTFLDPVSKDEARLEANRWVKRLRLVTYNGVAMRDRFTYGDDSLWWFTELYLHKMRRLDTAVAVAHALERMCATLAPARVVLGGASSIAREVAHAFGAARGVAIDTGDAVPPRRDRWNEIMTALAASLSVWRPRQTVSTGRGVRAAAFIHAAFWRPEPDASDASGRAEAYVGPILDALAAEVGDTQVARVGLGPSRNFRARRWWDPLLGWNRSSGTVTPIEHFVTRTATRRSLDFWGHRREMAAAIVSGQDVRDAGVIYGLDLWPILERELQNAALIQWPWSVKAMNEAGDAIDALSPSVVVTYAEAGGWGRALMLEARRRGVPSVGIQHGFIYRHWLNYLHEADELIPHGSDRGFPHPDRTLLFDRYAAAHLETAGHFPSSSLDVVGSPKLDDLVQRRQAETARVAAIRGRLRVPALAPVLVLAAKYSEIASHLPPLFEAVGRISDCQLVIKSHPAESPDVYRALIGDATNITIAPVGLDLSEALTIATGLITMNSTVAFDCLLLGIPSLSVGGPNNLSPFVDAGAMLGVAAGGDPMPALRLLLYDEQARRALIEQAGAFAARHGIQADGQAATRAARSIVEMAGRGRQVS